MRLSQRLATLEASEIVNDFGIWAEAPFTEDSESRIGRTQFENGGLLDEKQFVCTLASLTARIDAQIDEADGDIEYQREIAIETLIAELEDERLEERNLKVDCGNGFTFEGESKENLETELGFKL